MIKFITTYIILLTSCIAIAQQTTQEGLNILSYEEYMGYVKKHHPIIKQANLVLSQGEAKLLKSRGGFDPKIEIDFKTKEFKGIDYFDLLSGTFKVPTWYGIEFKANFEQNSGVFLNPEDDVPDEGLFSFGLTVSVLEGLLINDRAASLKKAKLFVKQSESERELLVNQLLLDASLAYFDWVKAKNEQLIFKDYLKNADNRFRAVKRNVETGSSAAIDSIESKIILQNRLVDLEANKLKLNEKRLKASNFIWLNNIPLELNDNIQPTLPNKLILVSTLEIENYINQNFSIDQHPKISALSSKVSGLEVDRRLKKNKLLPKLDVGYNFISSSPLETETFNTKEFKANINFSTPIFLRKERADLKLAKYKLQDANFEQLSTKLKIENKINNGYVAINSIHKQYNIIIDMVENYKTLVKASERKYFIGESSLLSLNIYERKLIEAELKKNSMKNKLLNSRAKLFNDTGLIQHLNNIK